MTTGDPLFGTTSKQPCCYGTWITERILLLTHCRAIFDTNECEKFVEKLESRIRLHDRDIEKLCSAHHQGFIESIRDLLELKSIANKLHVRLNYR